MSADAPLADGIPAKGILADGLLADLREWTPSAAPQRELALRYIDFVEKGGSAALARDGGPEHVTASCFVFTPDRSQVLLCLHKKGGFWVQLGGHIETSDQSAAESALREAREEGGITNLTPLSRLPVDLDWHSLGSGFRCGAHWDIGYAATALPGSIPEVSDESDAVAWFPVDALPGNIPPGFGDRLAGVLHELAATSAV
ncbi:MAG: pyrophosphohydrolase [Glaciihabitans sp.]|nr:pyrophosphohydrolase [Glaciihabitans sp.]